ncbi:MAG: hypothetical protein ICV72_01510 [Aldersonia sp.]|nr:hypothetical protein [Aldersonia sp.]
MLGRTIGFLATLVVITGLVPWTARADVTLPATTLGISGSITMPGSDGSTSVVVPVPPGLTPATLRVTVQLPSDVGRATVEVLADGRLISRVPVPTDVPSAPIALPLAGVPIVDNSATIELRSTLRPVDDGWCTQDWWDRGLTLQDAAVDFTGNEAQPTTISDFLPPALRELRLYVPPQPTDAETAAALTLGTAITARYSNADPTVSLLPLPAGGQPADPPNVLVRRVALAESDSAGSTLESTPAGPVLRVSGRGDQLIDQARLLTNDMSAFAVSTRAAVGALDPVPIYGPDTTSLSTLGQTTLTATATGRVSVRIGIDQTTLARPSGSVRVHLVGHHTPLPPDQGGDVTVRVGDTVVDHWPVAADGTIDRWVDIPDDQLGRFTELVVTVATAGVTTCGSTQPVTLSIDPDSVVTSERTAPPNPAGFRSLPQALMPRFDVGLAPGGFDDLRRALAITTGLQQLTSMPLAPQLVDPQAALDSGNPAVIVAADGGVPESVALPVRENGDSTIEVRGTDGTAESIDVPGLRFGSLQTAWDGDRNRILVVATSNDDSAGVDRILGWFSADRSRWGSVDGTAVIQSGNADPFVYGASSDAAPASSESGLGALAWTAIGVGLAAAVAGIAFAIAIVVRNRRSRT